jgi:hypothetical protein
MKKHFVWAAPFGVDAMPVVMKTSFQPSDMTATPALRADKIQ